jgi:predicted DNA-binding transcriptional regulator AlpA
MGRKADLDELIDAHDVAKLLGVSQPNTVFVYQRRYADMPLPAVDLGKGRVKLWLRPEVQAWADSHAARGRRRQRRR